jgi:hypothetical protein
MHVSLDDLGVEIPTAATLGELLDGLAPRIDPQRMVTRVEVDGTPIDGTDRVALAQRRLTGSEAIAIRTEAPAEFAQARRREIADHIQRIADLLSAAAEGLAAGETVRSNRALSGAARALGLVLELDNRLVALDGGPSGCAGIAETVQRIGPRLEAAERAHRWQEVAELLCDELVPALRRSPLVPDAGAPS